MYKIGYVDENPQEVTKFERKLRLNFNLIGYNIPRGLPKQELLDQIYDSNIDFLMVDFVMRDKGHVTYNGDEIIHDFELIMPRFPMIIFTNNENDAFPAVDDPNIIYSKEMINAEPEKFFQIVNKNIENYRKYINERKAQIGSLIQKREEEGLTAQEKEELFSLQLDLNNLDSRSKQAPGYLLSDLKLDTLNSAADEAEEFLKKLMNKDDNSSTKNS